jgi:2'-hydroxyisoflavone reductase
MWQLVEFGVNQGPFVHGPLTNCLPWNAVKGCPMKLTRRQLAQLGLVGLAGMNPLLASATSPPKTAAGLKILILGGTGFLGPHIVNNAVASGHTVTLFNRGKTDPHLFPELEKLVGTRSGNLEPLQGRQWDVVLDTSTFMPNEVQKSCALLKPNVGHYLYISSTAVYKDWSGPMDETAPVYNLKAPDSANYNSFQKYGAAKAGCERQVIKHFPQQHTVIRSDAIAGPGDKHHRYTYWIRKAAMGGEILGPGRPSTFVQYIDVRDLAQWVVHCAENSVNGTFNASSKASAYTMETMINDCRTASDTASSVVWVDSEFLVAQGVQDIPFWVPLQDAMPGMGQLSVEKAMQNGLQQRAKLDTARDVFEWYQGFPAEDKVLGVGISQEQQAQLIAAWNKLQEAA